MAHRGLGCFHWETQAVPMNVVARAQTSPRQVGEEGRGQQPVRVSMASFHGASWASQGPEEPTNQPDLQAVSISQSSSEHWLFAQSACWSACSPYQPGIHVKCMLTSCRLIQTGAAAGPCPSCSIILLPRAPLCGHTPHKQLSGWISLLSTPVGALQAKEEHTLQE